MTTLGTGQTLYDWGGFLSNPTLHRLIGEMLDAHGSVAELNRTRLPEQNTRRQGLLFFRRSTKTLFAHSVKSGHESLCMRDRLCQVAVNVNGGLGGALR